MLGTRQTLESYDQDSYKTVDYLLSLPTCTGLIGATGMCLGGHLALRAAASFPACPSFVPRTSHHLRLAKALASPPFMIQWSGQWARWKGRRPLPGRPMILVQGTSIPATNPPSQLANDSLQLLTPYPKLTLSFPSSTLA